jgi:hypothetical protein
MSLNVVPDIYLTTHGGVNTPTDWRLYCIFTFLYGSRGLVFALVCHFNRRAEKADRWQLMIFVDPCLRKVSWIHLHCASLSDHQGAKAAWIARFRQKSHGEGFVRHICRA